MQNILKKIKKAAKISLQDEFFVIDYVKY